MDISNLFKQISPDFLKKQDEITKEMLSSDFELQNKLSELCLDKDKLTSAIDSSLPSIRRVLEDKLPCKECQGYYQCKKQDKKGFVSSPYYIEENNSFEDKLQMCQYLKKIDESLKNIYVSDYEKMKIYALADKAIGAFNKNAIEHSFSKVGSKCVSKVLNLSKNLDTKHLGYYLYSMDTNGKAILLATAFLAAKIGMKVAVIDAKNSFNAAMSSLDDYASITRKIELAAKADVLFVCDAGFELVRNNKINTLYSSLLSTRRKIGCLTFVSSFKTEEDFISSITYGSEQRNAMYNLFDNIFEEIKVQDTQRFSELDF